MKPIEITLFGLLILASYSCHYQRDNTDKENTLAAKIISSKKSVINKKNNFELKKSELNKKLITEILTTSPRFQQLTKGLTEKVIKNGGLSFEFRLERGPFSSNSKKWDYSKTYDFTVYEVYSDRTLNTNRFTYDPSKNQLFEYNAADDKLEPIEFDRSLFLTYGVFCKWR